MACHRSITSDDARQLGDDIVAGLWQHEERYDEPKEPPPDPALMSHYLWLVYPAHSASEQERTAAKAALIQLYRDQREQLGRGRRSEIDPRLLAFVRDALRWCIRQSDPLGAIERLLAEKKRNRGRPATPHRDFVIAGDIAERVESGWSIELACAQLEKEGTTGLASITVALSEDF